MPVMSPTKMERFRSTRLLFVHWEVLHSPTCQYDQRNLQQPPQGCSDSVHRYYGHHNPSRLGEERSVEPRSGSTSYCVLVSAFLQVLRDTESRRDLWNIRPCCPVLQCHSQPRQGVSMLDLYLEHWLRRSYGFEHKFYFYCLWQGAGVALTPRIYFLVSGLQSRRFLPPLFGVHSDPVGPNICRPYSVNRASLNLAGAKHCLFPLTT
jgi:hypothetical protein